MWYFTWILGVLLACAFGIINVLWLEAQEGLDQDSVVLNPLTRLPNRVEFLNRLAEYIDHFNQDQAVFSLLMVSLDRYNSVFSQSQAEADQMVLALADVIRKEVRLPVDTLSQYDAGTFAIILPSAETEQAQSIAQRICENAGQALSGAREDSVVSVGVGEYPLHLTCGTDDNIQDQVRHVLEMIDDAVGQARQQGGNQFCCSVEA